MGSPSKRNERFSARLLPCVMLYVGLLFMTQFLTTCIIKRLRVDQRRRGAI